jgi:N-acetylated-alpha-linked acidic dipeptidase
MPLKLFRLQVALAVWLLAASAPAQERLPGFTVSSSVRQRALEEKFKALPSPDEERRQHRVFTLEPHPAGSARNNQLARYIARQWKQQGLEDVTIHRYDVYSTAPRRASLEMIAPVRYRASLREAPYPMDSDTANKHVSSAWAGMSISGDVTAPVIYAHSGNPEDYDLLRQNGIDPRGKIALVRYSNPYSYRGFKALTAQREGVAALLVYSDPAEDGYKKGPVFPDGPWGPETHIQRGAITYDFMVPGDPLTPGWASVPGAPHIAMAQAASLPRIMALPLSWHDAKPLLEHMDGPLAPEAWQGGLPLRYRFGGGAVRARLKIRMDNSIKPYYVVEARIRGSERPDEWVILGNHRDAWVFGGVDPSSGTASLMELTRSLGAMLQQNIRPRRTLIFCSWDGEEIGLTGSTEWGEQYVNQLRQKAVAYINVDSSTSGPNLRASAVPSLAPLLILTSHTLDDPSGKPLYDAWRSSRDQERREAKELGPVTDSNLVDTRIGSGSDHTVFLNFVGMPVVGLQFDGAYGVYHSMYDDYYWMNRFGDPGYRYHTLMSQLWGVLALRLANADLLPFDFAAYGDNLRQFVQALPRGPDRSQLDLQPLLNAVDNFELSGLRLDAYLDRALASARLSPQLAADINAGLMQVERNWLNPDGLPGRPWFKHMIYACRYTYAHLELPGIAEAIEKRDWAAARQQAALLVRALEKNAILLNRLSSQLAQPAKFH